MGAMYCSSPRVLSGSRVAADAKNSSGTTVTRPDATSSRVCAQPRWPKVKAAGELQVHQVAEGDRGQQGRLHGQGLHGAAVDLLLEQPVRGEAGRQRQGDPGRRP